MKKTLLAYRPYQNRLWAEFDLWVALALQEAELKKAVQAHSFFSVVLSECSEEEESEESKKVGRDRGG